MQCIIILKKGIYIKVINSFLFWFFFSATSSLFAQNEIFTPPDSLLNKDYQYIYTRYTQKANDTIASLLYLNTYLAKATVDNDKIKKTIAYNLLSYYTNNKRLKLSLINKSLSEGSTLDSIYTIETYNNLGEYFQYNYDYEKALKQYLIVLKIAEKGGYINYEIIALNNIADIKQGIGKNKEALSLYKKSFYESKKTSGPHHSITHNVAINLAQSFRKNKKYDSASYFYRFIIDNYDSNDPYYKYRISIVNINEGINLFFKGQLKNAERLLKEGASYISDIDLPDSKSYHILSQFYLGKIYQSLDENEAKRYFTKVDSLSTLTKTILPEVREAYEFLITEFKNKNDNLQTLHIVNRLLSFDSIISIRNINTIDKLHSEYDTPKLLKSKNQIIDSLEKKTRYYNLKLFLFLIVTLSLIILFFSQSRKHKLYKKRFLNIIKEIDNQSIEKEKPDLKKTVSINNNIDDSIVTEILDKLSIFETRGEFLKKSITVSSLAKRLSTNTKYLSKTINIHKGKSFTQYINDLRIDYVLKELKTNTKLQRYTILSIAKEIGFNSQEAFSASFKKRTGITPAYYIKNIKK